MRHHRESRSQQPPFTFLRTRNIKSALMVYASVVHSMVDMQSKQLETKEGNMAKKAKKAAAKKKTAKKKTAKKK